MNARAMSILLSGKPPPKHMLIYDNIGSPTSQKKHIIGSSHKDAHNRTSSFSNERNLQSQLDQIELPRDTMYMIDKVVRQRAKRGPFGVENSEIINGSATKPSDDKNERIQRLVDGMSSHSQTNHHQDDTTQIKDPDMSGEVAARRINSVCGRTTSTMVPGSVKGIHFSNEKALDDQHSSIQSVRTMSYTQWCKQKEMMQRLKDQLIEDAKIEILENMHEKEHDDTKSHQNFESFSKLFTKFGYIYFVLETWAKAKDKEMKVKKLEGKREKMIKHMHKARKQEMADKGFKSWLKMSLMKAKQVS